MTRSRKRLLPEGPCLWDALLESEPEPRPAPMETPGVESPETGSRSPSPPRSRSNHKHAKSAPDWIGDLYRRILAKYAGEEAIPMRVEFYRYAGLKNSVRYTSRGILFRLSDLMEDAPRPVIEATGHLLLARLHHRKCPTRYERLYYEFTRSDDMDEASHEAHSARRRVRLPDPKGHWYDLRDSFERINATYYKGQLPEFELTWSESQARTLLGHHDGHLNRITVSRIMDSPKVPQYVLDYIMFHEILHFVIPIARQNGRRVVHPPKFRKAEKVYRHYQEALDWLDKHL